MKVTYDAEVDVQIGESDEDKRGVIFDFDEKGRGLSLKFWMLLNRSGILKP